MGNTSESNILVASEELVIQSLTSMRDGNLNFFIDEKMDFRSRNKEGNDDNVEIGGGIPTLGEGVEDSQPVFDKTLVPIVLPHLENTDKDKDEDNMSSTLIRRTFRKGKEKATEEDKFKPDPRTLDDHKKS